MNKSANNRWWTFCFEHCKACHFRICWFSIECLVMWVRSINRYFTINSSHFQKQPILPYYYFNQYKIQSEFLNNRHNVCTGTLKGPWLCWSFVLSEVFNCLLYFFCSFIHRLMIISTILRIITFTTNQCLIDTKIKTIPSGYEPNKNL